MNEAYSEKLIKDVSEQDTKIAITGLIISKDEHSVVIDDGSAKMPVFFDLMKIPDARYLRIFGRVIPYEGGLQIQADVVQDLSNINYDLYRKMIGIMKKKQEQTAQ